MDSNATGNVSGLWQADEMVGLRLGTCVLERPLGVGGMGAVYLARQERPRRQVAVKVLRPRHSVDIDPAAWGRFLARFRREADAAAALDHANIVPIYEFGEEGDAAYLVMPYLADGSLAQRLARTGPLQVADAAAYASQAAAALDHAHAHGLVHRDVKPSNLLLHPDGRLLLADFGLAHALNRADVAMPTMLDHELTGADGTLTQHGMVMGTPEFMAPEQILRKRVGAAADIYALGIVTYAMLVGHTPFMDDAPAAVFTRQLNEPPAPIRPVRPDVSPQMETVLFWALAKDPADRPASAGEFALALQQASTSRKLSTLFGWRAPSGANAPQPGFAASGVRSLVPFAPISQPPSDATIVEGMVVGRSYAAMWPGAEDVYSRQATSRRQGPLVGILVGGALLALLLVVVGASVLANSLPSFTASLTGTPASNGLVPVGATATAYPTSTPSPEATDTPVVTNWLAVSDASLTVGCGRHDRSQSITLYNNGPDAVEWTAHAQSSPMLLVQVRPQEGRLSAGRHVTISITVRAISSGQNGSVTFAPNDQNAGQPVTVNFTTSCGN